MAASMAASSTPLHMHTMRLRAASMRPVSSAARLAGAASPPAQASSASCARRSPVSRNAAGAPSAVRRRRSTPRAGSSKAASGQRNSRASSSSSSAAPSGASAAPSCRRAPPGGRQDHRVVVAAQPRGQAGAQRRAVALDPAARPPSQLGRLGRDGRMLEFRLAGDGIRRVMRQRVHAQSGHVGAAPVHRQEGLAGPEPSSGRAGSTMLPRRDLSRASAPGASLSLRMSSGCSDTGLIHMLRQHAGERGARQRVPMVAQPPVVSLSG